MGRGNVCVTGPHECLYYVDNDYLATYVRKDEDGIYEGISGVEYQALPPEEQCEWELDIVSDDGREDLISALQEELGRRFSFTACREWIDRERLAILKNGLFWICLEDNQWSIAVELIQKKDDWGGYVAPGLQKMMSVPYLNAIREVLLDLVPEIGTYSGAWTHGTLSRS